MPDNRLMEALVRSNLTAAHEDGLTKFKVVPGAKGGSPEVTGSMTLPKSKRQSILQTPGFAEALFAGGGGGARTNLTGLTPEQISGIMRQDIALNQQRMSAGDLLRRAGTSDVQAGLAERRITSAEGVAKRSVTSREKIAEAALAETKAYHSAVAGTRNFNQLYKIMGARLAQQKEAMALEDRPDKKRNLALDIKMKERILAGPPEGMVAGLKVTANIEEYKDDREKGKIFVDSYNLETGLPNSNMYYSWRGVGITGLDKEWAPTELPVIKGKQVTLEDVRFTMEQNGMTFEEVIGAISK